MIFVAIALFVLGAIAGLFGFVVDASASVAATAQMLCAAFFGAGFIMFVVDRAWGAFMLRRSFGRPSRADFDAPFRA